MLRFVGCFTLVGMPIKPVFQLFLGSALLKLWKRSPCLGGLAQGRDIGIVVLGRSEMGGLERLREQL